MLIRIMADTLSNVSFFMAVEQEKVWAIMMNDQCSSPFQPRDFPLKRQVPNWQWWRKEPGANDSRGCLNECRREST